MLAIDIISIPINTFVREKFTRDITRVCAEELGFAPADITVRFREVEGDCYGVDGRLQDRFTKHGRYVVQQPGPLVTFEMKLAWDEGKVSGKEKIKVRDRLAETVRQLDGAQQERINIYFEDRTRMVCPRRRTLFPFLR